MKKLLVLLVCLVIVGGTAFITGCASVPATDASGQTTVLQLRPAIEATRAVLRLGLPILAQSRGIPPEAVASVLAVVDPIIDAELYGGGVNIAEASVWKIERDNFVAGLAKRMTMAHYTDKKTGQVITPCPDEAANVAIIGPMIDQLAIQIQALAKQHSTSAPAVNPTTYAVVNTTT